MRTQDRRLPLGPKPYDAGLGCCDGYTEHAVVRYGRRQPGVAAVRVSFEDGHARLIRPQGAWMVSVLEGNDRVGGDQPQLPPVLIGPVVARLPVRGAAPVEIRLSRPATVRPPRSSTWPRAARRPTP